MSCISMSVSDNVRSLTLLSLILFPCVSLCVCASALSGSQRWRMPRYTSSILYPLLPRRPKLIPRKHQQAAKWLWVIEAEFFRSIRQQKSCLHRHKGRIPQTAVACLTSEQGMNFVNHPKSSRGFSLLLVNKLGSKSGHHGPYGPSIGNQS